MIKIFKQFQKQNIKYFVIAIFFSSIECVISTFQPYLLSKVTGYFQNIANGENINQNLNEALILFSIIVASVFVGFVFRLIARFFHVKSAIDIIYRLRNDLFVKLQWIEEGEFNKLSVSSVVSRATNDSYQYQEAVLAFFLFFFESLLFTIGALIFCIVLNPTLSSIFIVIIPVILAVYFTSNKKAQKYYDKNLYELDSVNRVMRENIAGTKTVRSFRIQEHQANRFEIHNLTWYKSIFKGEMLVYFGFIFLFFAFNFAIILILFFAGVLNYSNQPNPSITIENIIAFANYMIYVVFSVFGISMALVYINRTKPCINRIDEIMKIKNETNSRQGFSKEFVPSLEFKNVSFSYGIHNDESSSIIDNISFKVNPGEILGIIGPTGSGKSTIVSLAANLYEPEQGTIEFGGYSSKDINSKYLRKQVSVAFQEKFIFSGTIRSNIVMGNLNASQEKIELASKLACADEFIEKTNNKYDSEVLQNGNNLSGGQKQRLAIARAFAKESGIYILDDSLSALDNLTRDKVLKNIKNNFKDKTFIIVSQQVKTIKDADKIIVLDKGKIVDIGTHNTLLKSCSLYNKIYDSQKTIGE